ncbi:NUDIX domain-containing protein [Agrobacterium tumefaciens]|nr:NUDIX domain-containing protein [Agrobacterium tumefaciens]NTE55328.1 NUDIX domain-containing protein [Agrobacterium tumefaciens]NTE72768.1 NUDIX domain-containing protein [Agrobacterium tumefaciens]HCL64081.1 DNA mismatch repair protein MutT [Rhizobium sp.]
MRAAYSVGSTGIEQGSPLAIAQAGAICLRMGDRPDEDEIALVASRTNGTWGIPKGHVELGESLRQAAEREAFEEAGAKGVTLEPAIGQFSYYKEGRLLRYSVSVHLLFVQTIAPYFPENNERQIKWVPLTGAAREVANRELSRIIASVRTHPLYEEHAGRDL